MKRFLSPMFFMTKCDLQLMRKAIDQAKLSESKRVSRTDPLVGAVLLTKTGIELTGYRGEKRVGDHAEYTVLEKTEARNLDLTGATLFTTLEPCTTRNHPKVPCAQRILDSRIAKVWIGMLDANPDVYAEGMRLLDLGGVDVEFFPANLRDEIKKLNSEFIGQFTAKGQLLLSDYWSAGSIENIYYVQESTIRRFIWGDPSGSTDLKSQHFYMEDARKTSGISEVVAALAKTFPHPTVWTPDLPVGFTTLTLNSSILLKNPSKSSPLVFTPLPSTKEMCDKDWLRHGLTLSIQINPNQRQITLDPGGYFLMPVTVRLDLCRSGPCGAEDLVEQDLVAGQALKDWAVDGIEDLPLHIRLLNGTDIVKEFGLKVIDDTGKLSIIENIDTKTFLKYWSEIRSWIYKRGLELIKQHQG